MIWAWPQLDSGHTIFDGLVIKSGVVHLTPTGAGFNCSCKAWVHVPVRYDAVIF